MIKKFFIYKNMNIPIPSNINMTWNMGFLISMFMMIQILTGFILSMNYNFMSNPFNNTLNIYYNMNFGWMFRLLHCNMPSLLFILMLMHMFRNLYFNCFKNTSMWISGMMMMMMMMMISFMGYILPWSQMSYWGMMVITNSISIIPYIGNNLMLLMWGNFIINLTSINRMFSLHFILPFMLILMMMMHLFLLHNKGSNNPLGINNKIDMVSFNYFFIKDLIMLIIMIIMMLNLILIWPYYLNNKDNFIMMNYFSTPYKIEPEWYFLFFYSILRSINNKFNGLMLTIFSMLMLFMMPLFFYNKMQSMKFYILFKSLFWLLIMIMIMMSWIGNKPITYPFMLINKLLIIIFFMYFPLMMMMAKIYDYLI